MGASHYLKCVIGPGARVVALQQAGGRQAGITDRPAGAATEHLRPTLGGGDSAGGSGRTTAGFKRPQA